MSDLKRFGWITVMALGGYGVLGAFLYCCQPAQAQPEPVPVTSAIVAPIVPVEPARPDAGVSMTPAPVPAVLRLQQYLTQAAMAWMTAKPALVRSIDNPSEQEMDAFEKQEHETWDVVVLRIQTVASEVADIFSGQEACLWPGREEPECPRSALTVMSIAFNESRFRGYVDDGRCNDLTWWHTPEGNALLRFGTCDDRLAFTIFQLHEFKGSRKAAEVEVLVRLRRSLHVWNDIRGYTGEGLWASTDGLKPPAALKRQELADHYLRSHPWE